MSNVTFYIESFLLSSAERLRGSKEMLTFLRRRTGGSVANTLGTGISVVKEKPEFYRQGGTGLNFSVGSRQGGRMDDTLLGEHNVHIVHCTSPRGPCKLMPVCLL